MAEENNSEEEVKEATPDTGAASSGSGGVQLSRRETEQRASITDLYFSNGNKLLTLPGSSLVVNDDTRRLLALFSDGRFLVVETHKFDGRVLSFEVLARKKRLNISKPTYVSQNELNAVYSIAERSAAAAEIEEDSDLDQLQMQKDFVAVVERAAAKKVSDVHVVVADSTQIMFRTNGMMQTEMEYKQGMGRAVRPRSFCFCGHLGLQLCSKRISGCTKTGVDAVTRLQRKIDAAAQCAGYSTAI